ncbi:cysteine-rich protein 2-binding protein isoform X2 [Photinus pyralis]|nr:cysteine-rich protein 2-binding protein isoform X2 [Photinus pyralis]
MPWLQAILLVLYHMQTRSPGLARKGYFHWKIHIASFIDHSWDILFRKDFKRKKKWMGTISGTLSHYSPHFFKSGTTLFNEQGWWTLTYPRLTPAQIVQLNVELMAEKQKLRDSKLAIDDGQLLRGILLTKPYVTEEMLQITSREETVESDETPQLSKVQKKKRLLLPTVASLGLPKVKKSRTVDAATKPEVTAKPPMYLDPLCHYNTSLDEHSRVAALSMTARLMGGVRKELILSPYTSIYLPPYIRRDVRIRPIWLHLMDELKAKVTPDVSLPKRAPLDFMYVQPEHIPAVNSLCNQFFWTGIDLSDTLRYPDFSCVVLYRKLIVAFAFVVPDVNVNECYVSFVFTRPGWRKCGIARFMLYHLIQTCLGRDMTLHVSISNSALFLYQKFGFKVEYVVLDFYNRYMRDDTCESKHAFFCRLER